MAKNIAPAVSVVMSTYNNQATLAEAIDSILAQTFRDFEFIIVDDGSTDRTSQILSSYKDRRLRIITRSNQGLVASLNRAIETPTDGNVAAYMSYQQLLTQRAERFARIWQRVLWTHPELDPTVGEPVSAAGIGLRPRYR